MADGVYLTGYKRPQSKKQLQEIAKAGGKIMIEKTEVFREETTDIKYLPDGTYYVVIPSPQQRKSFAQIIKKGEKITVK